MKDKSSKNLVPFLNAKSSKLKAILVIYHKNCDDGFGGAWAAWKKFGKKADYLAEEQGSPIPKGINGKDVYIIDFSYPLEETKRLLKIAKSLTIIDHHISAKNVVQMVPNHRYALNHSGATLAWKYFHPKKRVPKLLKHIEDVDLWKFKLKDTKEIIASLELRDFDFKIWNKFASDLENKSGLRKHLEEGRVIREYERKVVEKAVYRSNIVMFEGYKTMASNSNVARSEIGNALVKAMPPIGIVFSEINGKKIISLRSNGKADVSKLAQKYGGGGHKKAAAFRLELNKPYPWKIIKPSN